MTTDEDDPDYTDYEGPVSTGCPELNRKAFIEGYEAKVRGNNHNPYPPNSNGWWHWEDGYEATSVT